MIRKNWYAALILALTVVGCRPFAELADSPSETATSTQAVLAHHLQAFGEGIEAIMADYTEDSVVIVPDATHHGLAEIRSFFTSFAESNPEGFGAAFRMKRQEVFGEVAYILWEAKPWCPLGTDTFVIRDGKIVFQTYAAYRPNS